MTPHGITRAHATSFKASQDTLISPCTLLLTSERYMADIKLEPQEANHLSQDSLLGSFSPLQEHKPQVSL